MEIEDYNKSAWIFGYGSIIWKTSFPFSEKCYGYIKGYSRRFWQGSHDHRGTKDNPGRVVTLISSKDEITWGVAYRINERDWDSVINNLNSRENDGYSSILSTFYTNQHSDDFSFNVWIYVAHPENQSFLGYAPLDLIAQQIVESKGPSGSNVEYLLKLAESLREIGPWALDFHTLQLENTVKDKLKDLIK
ncbi:hypothetical protein HZS_922 [Henneguya salminicola]|uniref:glutathione-specific gamma-glutamylcyclotransferase n=1 Tax=Henneguya salminicola TaxID=69463 RepID=A0A6G3MH28_HENSL|nr:hypothetical protein HZS_922 [Henneguya salminicola]